MFVKRNEGLVKLSLIFSSTMSNYIKKTLQNKHTNKNPYPVTGFSEPSSPACPWMMAEVL